MNNQPADRLILRHHKGQKPGVDWFESAAYSEADINGIEDPAGASARYEITSIPSPFARFHVFETAFREVASMSKDSQGQKMEGTTIYHKLVSNALDVGEIFFNFSFFKEKHNLNITTWNKSEAITRLKAKKEHKLLGETLELYVKQADVKSNLSLVENFHMLSCNFRVFGGTSPTTMFFCASGNLSQFVELGIGKDKFFDDIYFPLHRRSIDFQLYLHGLFAVAPSLQKKMPLFWDYLKQSMECLERDNMASYMQLRDKLSNYDETKFNADFDEANTGIPNSLLEVLPNIYHRRKKETAMDEIESDFTIGTYKATGGKNTRAKSKLPLVLQNGFQKKLSYVHGEWDAGYIVPYFDAQPIELRILPGQSQKYPYLTVSDFLEPTLVKMPFPLNEAFFFSGNRTGFDIGKKSGERPEEGYLLPIKDEFFHYFDVEDLRGKCMPGGQPVFSMAKKSESEIEVRLRLPIQKSGEYLLFERTYETGVEPNPEQNKGAIVDMFFNLALMPFAKIEALRQQRIMLASSKGERHELALYKDMPSFAPVYFERSTMRSDQAKRHEVTTRYLEPKEDYSIIRIMRGENVGGILLPDYGGRGLPGGEQFTFAVDFGTTNTHIEYAEGSSEPRAFSIGNKEEQLITVFDPKWEMVRHKVLQEIFEYEAMPFHLGKGARYGFPFQTVSSETEGFNPSKAFGFGDINIPFYFGDLPKPESHLLHTNLKWQSLAEGQATESNRARVRCFIETLMMMMRNKVLLQSGDLSKTKVAWFLPSSMGTDQAGSFQRIWDELFEEYFGTGEKKKKEGANLRRFSESLVPFFGLDEDDVKSSQYPVVNIDIGGGTTDIVVFSDRLPKCLTSVKFAGDALFGDGYTAAKKQTNGFVQFFKPRVESFIQQNSLTGLKEVLDQLADNRYFSSSDIMSFFFSIQKNPTVRDAKLKFSINEHLHDHAEFNMIYVVFYGAIVFHVAKLMKQLKLPMPRQIALSGNGSKIIRLLNVELKPIEQFTMKVFEKVYGEAYHQDGLNILHPDHPKELTSKGGVKLLQDHRFDEDAHDELVLLGDQAQTIVNPYGKNFPTAKLQYKDLTEMTKQSAAQEVKEFIKMLFDLEEEFSYRKNFGINVGQLDQFRTILERDLPDSLKKGLARQMNWSSEKEVVSETLFFYPLLGSIHALIQFISSKK